VADFAQILTQLAYSYGYPGVFLASLLGSLVPFLPVPYLIVVILLSKTLDPLTLGVVAGVGGALGKSTSYILGRSGYLFSGERTKKNLKFLGGFVGKYGDLGVFVFAVTPLPDDLYYVPLGMVGFPFWRLMLANTAGKVILSTGVAYFGRQYFEAAKFYLGGSELVTTLLLLALTLAVTIVLARADWEAAYTIYKEGGTTAVLRRLDEVLGFRRPPTSS